MAAGSRLGEAPVDAEVLELEALVARFGAGAVFLAVPPAPRRYTGRRAIARYLASSAGGRLGRVALVETRANCGPALAVYRDEARSFRAHAIFVLVESGDPADVVGFADASLFPYFGLPALLRPPGLDRPLDDW